MHVPPAAAVAGSADRALALTRAEGPRLPLPGRGSTAERWATLARMAADDLTAARVLEAHSDALAILGEAADAGFGIDAPSDALWGVFAAEGPGVRLSASEAAGSWSISGTKPWCSLASRLDRALVTAFVGPGTRRLFAIDLTSPRVSADETGWVARGLVEVPSVAIHLADLFRRPRRSGRLVPRPRRVRLGRHGRRRLLVRRCGRDRPHDARGAADP